MFQGRVSGGVARGDGPRPAAARPGLRRPCTTCKASEQLARPPSQLTSHRIRESAEHAAEQAAGDNSQRAASGWHQQQLQSPQQQQQKQLLTRPIMSPSQQQQEQQQTNQPGKGKRQVVLDDGDTKMAAFDQLVIQVTCTKGASQPSVAVSFNKGRVRPIIAKNLKAARINRPTPLQGHMLPAIEAGHDILASGPPGAGTSTGALLAVLCKVLSTPRTVPPNKAMPLAMVLCPSRELAMQLAAEGAKLVAKTQMTVKCITGGAELAQQVIDLRNGADVLVCTPGRLMDLLGKRVISLARLKHLVMEDIDELRGPVLLPVTRQVLHHHTMPSYQLRQTIALGSSALPQQQLLAASTDALRPSAVVIRAAWPLPGNLQDRHKSTDSTGLCADLNVAALATLLASPAAGLAVSAAAAAAAIPPTVTQRFLGVTPQLKLRTLLRLLSAGTAAGGGGLVLVFTNSHTAADEVGRQLEQAGVSAGVLHYARSQTQRDEALQCFKYGVTQVLVACGIIYRGINLPDVAQVISYDTPLSLAEYARRLGRAGREGRQGTGTTLVTPSDGAAVAPLVAVLRAGRQLVPDWLLAIAEGAGDIVAGDAATDGGEGAEDCSTSGSASEQARLMQPEALADARTVTSGVDSVATEARTAGDGRQKSSSRRQQDQSSHGSGGATFSVRSRRNHKAHFGSYMYDDELDVT